MLLYHEKDNTMKVLVFDTETTGLLPKDKNDEYPYIVQLSYVYFDTKNMKQIEAINSIVNVGDIEIPIETINIHGITNEKSHNLGRPIMDVLLEFSQYIDKTDIIVAHNLNFDKTVVIKEFERLGYPNYFNVYDKLYYDTMINGKELCQLYTKGHYKRPYLKFPKLVELYCKLFDDDNIAIANAHNAIIDVLMTTRCYLRMNSINNSLDFNKLYKQYLC
jgi:DNA polymerase III epsilon subunit-like protein